MLVDEIDIVLKGGHGGPGKVSFGKMMGSGPDGGNGGKGGDLYIRAISDIYALNPFTARNRRAAEDGNPGRQRKMTGGDGEDLIVDLPIGTVLVEKENGGETELGKVGEVRLICKGGKGGRGNWEFRSSRNTTPKYAQPGLPGEEKKFRAVLKLIADIGLIGLPNAGKSSLLNELTRAKAQVADYVFTTLEPNLGVLGKLVLADIPGLIEGASHGKGLGIKFLKHIEKVRLLVHCVSADSADVRHDYKAVRRELEEYDPGLAEKKEIVLLTKVDLLSEGERKGKSGTLGEYGKVTEVSIYDPESIEKVRELLLKS